jgi:creatinine amidohydrolase/Fe(II)-dependent formamide hydrolase-like protein
MPDRNPAAPFPPELSVLDAIDRLEVGPIRLEPRRLVAPYRVTKDGVSDATELIFRYEEDVFDPEDPASANLAAMIAAQVALNYGLFCREIVFHDPLDAADRVFILTFLAHTAREIFVVKILQPNPFLKPEATGLPALRLPSYSRAVVRFAEEVKTIPRQQAGSGGAPSYAILSSGGKDSLLSYGLLNEIGSETHPIFCNESGRHWFTSLNAFRFFSKSVPGTSRVWMNSDRVFAWMLRHLPFIRPDFLQVRSDEYPIRLWTVAVFLFGALPIVFKRGIGRVIIGDEFDTTIQRSHKGITHYAGLYDQGRHFDNGMTRYFFRKGWRIHQFSMVRTMSELLIEKTLVERYPHLQRVQVSCHAAHTDGKRVKPCGRCEKCRRIVGMLAAVGGDPTRCGYTKAQIARCLSEIAPLGVHQEGAGARHMTHLLHGKGLVSDPGKEHPEVLKLRFDPKASPFEAIPADLRRPLYEILLRHAAGSVEKRGRSWVPTDPLSPSALRVPYPFALPMSAFRRRTQVPEATEKNPARARPPEEGEPPKDYNLGDLTWPEAQARFREVDIALLPVGSVEQHGPHLPLDTDAFDARRLAEDVALRCERPRPLVLPLIPYGVSYHHDDFPGTISLGPDTLARMVHEIGLDLARHGVTKLVIINGHGGNGPALHFAAQLINRDARIFTCVDTGETSDSDIEAMTETPNDVHAGEVETSTTLFLRPGHVKSAGVKPAIPKFSSHYLDFTSKRGIGWYARTSRISPTGVLGDPTRASREKGEKMWGIMVDHLVQLVEDLKKMTLDEIHQRRY